MGSSDEEYPELVIAAAALLFLWNKQARLIAKSKLRAHGLTHFFKTKGLPHKYWISSILLKKQGEDRVALLRKKMKKGTLLDCWSSTVSEQQNYQNPWLPATSNLDQQSFRASCKAPDLVPLTARPPARPLLRGCSRQGTVPTVPGTGSAVGTDWARRGGACEGGSESHKARPSRMAARCLGEGHGLGRRSMVRQDLQYYTAFQWKA